MTRKEAIEMLKKDKKQRSNCYISDAIDIAIKTLEQEFILDKIRFEIEKKIVKRPWLDFEDRERDRNDAFLEVLDIIDKYKDK